MSAIRTVSIFKNGRNQAVRLPKEFEYEGLSELEAVKEGDVIVLRPVRESWLSLREEVEPVPGFLEERPGIFEEGRVTLEDESEVSK